MGNFKGTKGEWFFDENTKAIKNENTKGLLATAWSVYNPDSVEIRNENESWLQMRERTKSIRELKEEERIYNAKLIAAAPEMLKQLEDILFYLKDRPEPLLSFKIEQLIKKATE